MFISIPYPYLPYMVQDLLYPGEESTQATDKMVSIFTGLLASCFCLAQICSNKIWTHLSERTGYHKAILGGLLSNTVLSLIFGVARSYALALIIRFISGILNGNLGVIKAYAKDITNENTRANLFGWIGFSWVLGLIIGPALGGLLSQVSHRFPNSFPPGSFFDEFRYFMPMLVLAMFSFFILLPLWYFLMVDAEMNRSSQFRGRLCNKRRFIMSTSIYVLCGLAFIGFQEVFPLWCKALRQSGGLGITDELIIGLIQSAGGVSVMMFQILLVPCTSNKFGILFVIKIALFVCIPVFFSIAFFTYVYGDVLYFGIAVFYSMFAAIQASVMTCMAIVIRNSIPLSLLANTSSIVQFVSSLICFIGPITYGGIFGWSVDNDMGFPLNSHFIFIISTFFVILAFFLLYFLPKSINYSNEPALEVVANEPALEVVANEPARRTRTERLLPRSHRAK